MVIGELFISAFLQALFQTLMTPLLDEIIRGSEWDNILTKLNTTLARVNAERIDAEVQITNPEGQSWINDLKDAVYHAEDVLDDIATKVSLSNQVFSNRVSLKSLKKVKERLENLVSQGPSLNLRQITRVTTTSLENQKVFGRRTEKETIMDFLMADNEDNSNISVVSIVGIGGVGKTTLAQLLFNEMRIENHFDRPKAWIYVSEKDNVFSLTKTVYESVTSTTCPITNLDGLQVSLKEKLLGKKILLVFDDMCSETFKEWDQLCQPFVSAAKGSWIIVTTRSHHVVKNVCASYTHALQPLPYEECWRLFIDQVCGAQKQDLNREFGTLAEKIVWKCQGLPLAAKAFGGLLKSNREADYWRKILNSKIWTLPTDSINILAVLRVSYHYLPPHLKRCFAYCSIFPKGYAFDKEMVVLLWMAEGLVEQADNIERTEHVGDEYFSELVSRSLFEQRKSDTKFIMHDLINELAQFAAGEFCFRFEEQIQGVSSKIRHLSYLRNQYSGEAMKFEVLHGAKSLRTFLPLSHGDSSSTCYLHQTVSHNLLPKLTCLRVLSLSHYDTTTLRQDIFSKMRHVRYLDLSGTNLQKLPTSVSFLYNLQTLLLAYCSHLIELDKTICNHIRLKHLDLTATTKLEQMPENFGTLKKLQTLTTFVVGAGKGAKISVLRELTDLRGKLTILQLHRVEDPSDAGEANLESKTHLKEINFTWRTVSLAMDYFPGKPNEDEIFEKLRPHNQIEELTIRNYCGNSFPMWMSDPSFSSIECLRLTGCQKCKSLPSLGRLPGLKKLHISGMKQLRSIGLEFYTSHPESLDQEQQPFRSLQILSLKDMPNWEEWVNVEVYGKSLFPNLQELSLVRCPKLTSGLPGLFPSLITFKILQSKNLVFQLDANKYKNLQQQGVTIL